jgi:hypothetical protein
VVSKVALAETAGAGLVVGEAVECAEADCTVAERVVARVAVPLAVLRVEVAHSAVVDHSHRVAQGREVVKVAATRVAVMGGVVMEEDGTAVAGPGEVARAKLAEGAGAGEAV